MYPPSPASLQFPLVAVNRVELGRGSLDSGNLCDRKCRGGIEPWLTKREFILKRGHIRLDGIEHPSFARGILWKRCDQFRDGEIVVEWSMRRIEKEDSSAPSSGQTPCMECLHDVGKYHMSPALALAFVYYVPARYPHSAAKGASAIRVCQWHATTITC